jgi:hypothetical protein
MIGTMPEDRSSPPDRDVDEALEETFPASDPPANTVETGIRIDIPAGRPPAPPSGEGRPDELPSD